jgi:nucleotide-binding universal stress UspA family protein
MLLVPVDFSDSSVRALHHAVDLATESHGSLIILHVVPADYGWLAIGREESRDLDKALQRQAVDRLRALANAHVRQNVPVDLEVRLGRPAEEIVAAANESKCHAIVMSTRGLTGLDRHLIGSVADRVARLAPCPVVLVRPGNDRRSEDKNALSFSASRITLKRPTSAEGLARMQAAVHTS